MDALFKACFEDRLDTVQQLLNTKLICVESKDSRGFSALALSVWNGHLDIVKWLVDVAGADTTAVDPDGRTALMTAADQGSLHIVRWLVGRSDITQCANNGESALMYAVYRHCYDEAQLLLTHGRAIGSIGLIESKALWNKLQPICPVFIYEDTRAPVRRASLLLRTMLMAHPAPVDVKFKYYAERDKIFFVRTCARATILRKHVALRFVVIKKSIEWLHPPIIPIVLAYADPSPAEVWFPVAQVPRRNPERAARKRPLP